MTTIPFKGKNLTITELQKQTGLSSRTIRDRLRRGWSLKDVVKPMKNYCWKAYGQVSTELYEELKESFGWDNADPDGFAW